MSPSDEGSRIRSAVVSREWLRGIYALARDGRFDFNARTVVYEEVRDSDDDRARATFDRLKDGVRNEVDCHVCYSLILDPLTTACGHTFCRKCVGQILTHSDLCPVCRRKLNLAPNVYSEPKNKRIADLIEVLFPEQIDARREAAAQDEPGVKRGIPLFVCTLAFPTMPMFLHVYERRYRLMIRRVMESGNRQFGMVAYNATNRPQGNMGRVPFMQYGTLVKVDRYELLPGGRSLVIATGVSRFKIAKSETVDGYHIGRIERVDDVSLTEEERVESMETSEVTEASSMEGVPEEILLDSMSTQQLFDLASDFLRRKREEGAPWLHPRILMAYGDLPTDPAQFPWWFASVVPVPEDFKYALLSTSSVRQRLKVTVRWVKRMDDRKWYVCPFLSYKLVHLVQVKPPVGPVCLMTSRPSPHLWPHQCSLRAAYLAGIIAAYSLFYFLHAILLLGFCLIRIYRSSILREPPATRPR